MASFRGGIAAFNSRVTVADSTIVENRVAHDGFFSARGGGVEVIGSCVAIIRNSTITGNVAETYAAYAPYGAFGGGLHVGPLAQLDLGNSIVAGNTAFDPGGYTQGRDIFGSIALSNGHNIFGSDVTSDIAGDRENVDPGTVFASLDPDTGGSRLGPNGAVAPRNSVDNPATSDADSLLVQAVDQLGMARFLPGSSRADIGAVEIG